MDFIKRTIFKKRTTTRSDLSVELNTPLSPVSSGLDDVEEDEIDYSSSIQQEAAGIRLQKNERMMMEEMNASLVRWSTEYKKWAEKWNGSTKKKEASFQPYTTTLNLFVTVITLLNQIGAQFDESSQEVSKILQKVPNHEDRSIKSELAREISMLKEAKRALDVLEKEQEQNKDDLNRTQKNLGNCRLNTRKYTKLQEHYNSLKQKRTQLKTDIVNQKATYRQVQNQYRANTKNIYDRSQKKELARLTNMSEPLRDFVAALKIDPALLAEAIQKHNPEVDLTSWKKKHFTSSFQETSV